MAKINFDYEGALKAGYSDDEILSYLSKENPDYDAQGAIKAGYSPGEVNMHLSGIESQKEKPEKSLSEKGARVAGQFALGAAESALLPYELAAAPLAQKEAQTVEYRKNLFEDIERLAEKKQSGEFDAQDEALLDSLVDQVKNPSKMAPFIKTADIGVRGIAEAVTGQDLHPEDFLEKAAHWTGFIKNPKNLLELSKDGLKLPDVVKTISPTGKEALRGVGAGATLQMAEEGNFGPIGTMAAAVVGDIAGAGAAGAVKGVKKLITKPKEALADVAKFFTKKDKINLQKDIIKDFQDSNIQADIGTITNNDLVKWVQSRLAQSGLTGNALDELKTQLTSQVKEEYKALAESLGEAKFSSAHEAGEIAKEGIKKIRESDLADTRKLYKEATASLSETAAVDSKKLASEISRIKKELEPGSIKSSDQQVVLDYLKKLERDLYDSEGNLLYGKVKDLMNNKTALNDVINYEVQGGTKQLLKGVVGELDRAIISHGKENPLFARKYIQANQKFSKHAKTFRNKDVAKLMETHDPAQLMSRMNSIQGMRDLKNILTKTPEGTQIFDNLKRMKLDQVIGDNLVDSTTQQVKLGTFSKLLEKGKNREVIKEMLSPEQFKRLDRLQRNSGKLADTAQKFLNTSKTGSTIEDVGVVVKVFSDLANLLAGNPWPLAKTAGGLVGARYLTKLIADPTFLKLVEETILAAENDNIPLMLRLGKQLVEPVKAATFNLSKDQQKTPKTQ